MIISLAKGQSHKENQITSQELYALVKAAASIPTCVQFKGTLMGREGWVYCDLHFYGKSTVGCTIWTDETGPVKYTARNFKSWVDLLLFIDSLTTSQLSNEDNNEI